VPLKRAMELAGQNLINCLCPTRNYLPYWNLRVNKDYTAEFNFWWPAHNIGRWWDAVLRLEDIIDFSIPASIEGAMLENLKTFVDNPDCLCYAPTDSGWGDLELHSLRETLLAFNALVRYRNSHWAAKQGHKMLEAVYLASRDNCNWDFDKLDYYRHYQKEAGKDWTTNQGVTASSGRMLEAIVWFYKATGDPLAFELANRFASYLLVNATNPDGEFSTNVHSGHTHSYFGMLRGLLLFGEMTRQREYIDAVAATYRVVVRRMVKESGFTSHDIGRDETGGGETTSPGDAAQLSLWLARNGYTDFLDDAARIVRARLLPSQITKSQGLKLTIDDGKDEHFNLDERIIGGMGGCHWEPHAGKQAVTDVTAAGLHSLIDIYNNIAIHTGVGLTVNFHFDYENDEIQIISERDRDATVRITVKNQQNIMVRIPKWTPTDSVQFTVNGNLITPLMIGNFAYLPRQLFPGEVILKYGLPVNTVMEKTGGVEYKIVWRGDDVIGISPNSDFFPFYPSLKE